MRTSISSPICSIRLTEGHGMKRVLAVTLAMVFVLSALSSGSALAVPKGNLQIGIGGAQVQGAPMAGLDWKVPTIHVGAMYFPASWAVLIADVSYGLPNEYEHTNGTDTDKITVESTYVDIMAGAVKHFDEFTIDTGAGFALGAGMQIPIRNSFMGFANFTQRCIPTKLKEDDRSLDMNAGGFEMTAGVAWTFGE
jgi:hypothetical protein